MSTAEKKTRTKAGSLRKSIVGNLLRYDVYSAWAFCTMLGVKGHLLAFSQGLVSSSLDCAVVHEYIIATTIRLTG